MIIVTPALEFDEITRTVYLQGVWKRLFYSNTNPEFYLLLKIENKS